MESNIVQDFQNLRVFSNRNINRMDELVQDLTSALEESSKGPNHVGGYQENTVSSGAVARRYYKRRRGARRATVNVYWKRGTISEASESSIDEAIRDFVDYNVTHSDSDDLVLSYPKQRLVVSVSEPVPPVESDSFTENLSPMRPQRRRRRYKHMAVDSLQAMSRPGESGQSCTHTRPICQTITEPSTSCAAEHRHISHHIHGATQGNSRGSAQHIVPGKRKRSGKSEKEILTEQCVTRSDKDGADMDSMEVASVSQESSLSSSEFDSDVYNNADEGREADDEQSDFFHEPDPVCGVPEIPWWESRAIINRTIASGKDDLDSLFLSGALSHMSKSSQKKFRQRMDKLIARAESGREIRIGKRKLKGNIPRYTMMRFLQDQERWNSMQGTLPAGSHFSPGASWNCGYSSQSGDCKRLRQTPPPMLDTTEEGSVGGSLVPAIPSTVETQHSWVSSKSGHSLTEDDSKDSAIAPRECGHNKPGYETQSDT